MSASEISDFDDDVPISSIVRGSAKRKRVCRSQLDSDNDFSDDEFLETTSSTTQDASLNGTFATTTPSTNVALSCSSTSRYSTPTSTPKVINKLMRPVACTTPEGNRQNATPHGPTYGNRELLQRILELQTETLERIKSLERRMNEKSPVDESDKKVFVPSGVRYAVRAGFTDGEKKGLKWHFEGGKRFTDEDNQTMNVHITNFVKGWNPNYSDQTIINNALARYFITKKQEQQQKENNKLDEGKKKRALYERKKEKSKRRLKAIDGLEISDVKKAEIRGAMAVPLMSSDEELEDGGFLTHQPSWQSEKFQKYKKILDAKYLEICSKKSARLLQKRTIGAPSTKPAPDNLKEDLQWILKK